MVDVRRIVSDLADEHDSLDALVRDLDPDAFDGATPAEGWSIRDQISHLTFFDEQARVAVEEPEEFAARLGAIAADPLTFTDGPLDKGRAMTPTEVLRWWREARAAMLRAFGSLTEGIRVPWFGPPMSAASFVSARVMETWAHGQDVADALGAERVPTDRLRHVAHLGVRARRFSYENRGLTAPAAPVAVILTGPSGDVWSWDPDGDGRVEGPALDFCLVVTQRRHIADTDLVVSGAPAEEWMAIAQAFAGPPGDGRRPGQFPRLQ